MHPLEQQSPDLFRKLKTSTPNKQKEVAIAACRIAIETNKNIDNNIKSILDSLGKLEPLLTEEKAKLVSLKDLLDKRYFSKKESGVDEKEYLPIFNEARIVSAILAVAEEDMVQAVYEASISLEDAKPFFQTLLKVMN